MCLAVYRHCLLRPLDTIATDKIQMLHEFTCYGYEKSSLSASTIWVSVAVIAHRRNSVTLLQISFASSQWINKWNWNSVSWTNTMHSVRECDGCKTDWACVSVPQNRCWFGLVCSFIVLHSISIAHANNIRISFSGELIKWNAITKTECSTFHNQ